MILRNYILINPMIVIDRKLEGFMSIENKCTIAIGTKIYRHIESLAPFEGVFVKVNESVVGNIVSAIYFDLKPKISYDEDYDE